MDLHSLHHVHHTESKLTAATSTDVKEKPSNLMRNVSVPAQKSYTKINKEQRDLQLMCMVLSLLSVSKCRDIESQVTLLRDKLRYQTLLTEYLVRKMRSLNVEMRKQSEVCQQLSQSLQEQHGHMTQCTQDAYRLLRKQQRINEQLFACVQYLRNKHSIQNIMIETAAVMSTMYLVSLVTNMLLNFVTTALKRRNFSAGSSSLHELLRYVMALQGVLVLRLIGRGTVRVCRRFLSRIPGALTIKSWFRKASRQTGHFS